MAIKNIYLTNFRNFKEKELKFSSQTTIIVGPNASGKTNILEALFLLSTGKSFKARVEEEMISYSADLSRINGRVNTDRQELGLEAVLTRGFIDIGKSALEKTARKRLAVNGVGKRLVDFAGNFRVVLFGPWDLGLVTESPSGRRNFLDTVLSQVDREYRRSILSYEKGLRQRNRVLWRIREDPSTSFGRSGRSMLVFWNQLLIKNGDYLSRKREEFINFVNSSPGLPAYSRPGLELEYDKSAISEARLEQYAEEEVAAATTLVGPHRDDFIFRITNHESRITAKRDLSRFGSRGEQRMGTLWLKLAELSFIETKTGERPTLLLDDILSELDHKHREVVMGVVGNQQTLITTADPHFIEDLKNTEIIHL